MKIWTTLILAVFGLLLVSTAAFADVYVQGYYKKNGTYVAPHYRSSPNSTKLDNWSTRGNVNPYTGNVGTRNPYNTYSIPPVGTVAPLQTYNPPPVATIPPLQYRPLAPGSRRSGYGN